MSKQSALDSVATLLVVLFFAALTMTGITWLVWLLAIGRTVGWSLLTVFYPMIAWGAAFAATLALAFVFDIGAWTCRRLARRRALRAALKGDA